MSIIWNKRKREYKIHGHSFRKSELKGEKSKKEIEDSETSRINPLLVSKGREVQIHIEHKSDTGLVIAVRPAGTPALKGTWWKARDLLPDLPPYLKLLG